MNLKLLRVGLLCAAIGLASCVDPVTTETTGTTADPSNPANVVVVANTGTVTVTTAPGNTVSIGASGTNSKTADTTGKAVFTGLTPGAVDVHVFSSDGYSASSYYGVNSNVVNDVFGVTGGSSVVDVYVQASNTVGFTTYYLDDGAGNVYWGDDLLSNGNVTFDIWERPAGTTLTATIYAGTGSATSTAGNNVFGPAELLNLGTVSVTTTAVSGAPQANLTAAFSATPVTAPNLVTINSITPATGTTTEYVDLSSSTSLYLLAPGDAFVFPDTIAAAPVPGDSTFFIFAGDALATKEWFKQSTYTVGGTLNVAAAMNAFPTAVAQTGAAISWTASTDTHIVEGLSIYDTSFVHQWNILTKSGVTSVTLPTPPTGVTAPLAVGMPYNMNVSNFAFAATYEQLIAAPSLGSFDLERVTASGIAYTR